MRFHAAFLLELEVGSLTIAGQSGKRFVSVCQTSAQVYNFHDLSHGITYGFENPEA